MGRRASDQPPVKLFFAVMARPGDAAEECERWLETEYGRIDTRDEPYEFDPLTDYYAREFGRGLWKRIFSVEPLIPPKRLVEMKIRTNAIENAFALERCETRTPEPPRVVNIDPGYLNHSKIVLASTKDHAHRIYVGRGIFEEVTLNYRRRPDAGFQPHPWTYPDYRTEERRNYFSRLRQVYDCQLKESQTERSG